MVLPAVLFSAVLLHIMRFIHVDLDVKGMISPRVDDTDTVSVIWP